MNPIFMKAVIIGFLVVGGSASGYTAVTLFSSSNPPSIDSFVPANSSVVLQYHANNTTDIAFVANSSVGAVVSTSYSSILSILNTTLPTSNNHEGTGSPAYNVTSVGSFDGYQVFSLVISASAVTPFMGHFHFPSMLSDPFHSWNDTQGFSPNCSSLIPSGGIDLYLSPVSTTFTVIGLPAAVYASISASVGTHFDVAANLNQTANVSLYVSGPNGGASAMLNVTFSSSTIDFSGFFPANLTSALNMLNSFLSSNMTLLGLTFHVSESASGNYVVFYGSFPSFMFTFLMQKQNFFPVN